MRRVKFGAFFPGFVHACLSQAWSLALTLKPGAEGLQLGWEEIPPDSKKIKTNQEDCSRCLNHRGKKMKWFNYPNF